MMIKNVLVCVYLHKTTCLKVHKLLKKLDVNYSMIEKDFYSSAFGSTNS